MQIEKIIISQRINSDYRIELLREFPETKTSPVVVFRIAF